MTFEPSARYQYEWQQSAATSGFRQTPGCLPNFANTTVSIDLARLASLVG